MLQEQGMQEKEGWVQMGEQRDIETLRMWRTDLFPTVDYTHPHASLF